MTDSNSTYGEEGADSSTESKPNWRRDLENRVKEAEARAAAAEGQLSGYQRQDTLRSAGIDLDDPRSQLFWEYVRLLRDLQPSYFLLENVKMKKQSMDVITEALGVEPIFINSSHKL